MVEPLTLIPEANHALREELFRFVQGKEEERAARILWLLRHSPVELFTHVKRKAGGVGEPPISASDLALMTVDNGQEVRIISAATKLTPDNISTDLEKRGIYCRQLPASRLLELCSERGVLLLDLDGGLETAVTIGPIAPDRELLVKAISIPFKGG